MLGPFLMYRKQTSFLKVETMNSNKLSQLAAELLTELRSATPKEFMGVMEDAPGEQTILATLRVMAANAGRMAAEPLFDATSVYEIDGLPGVRDLMAAMGLSAVQVDGDIFRG